MCMCLFILNVFDYFCSCCNTEIFHCIAQQELNNRTDVDIHYTFEILLLLFIGIPFQFVYKFELRKNESFYANKK